MKKMPSQGKDQNKGVYGTPLNLLYAVNIYFPIGFDLAATDENNVMRKLCPSCDDFSKTFFSEKQDSLTQSWEHLTFPGDFAWLNPPYDNISKWVSKCCTEQEMYASPVPIVLLVPAATGATWFSDMLSYAYLVFLIGRPVFEFTNPMTHPNPEKRGKPNTDPYGKDMVLAVFGDGKIGQIDWWNWKKDTWI